MENSRCQTFGHDNQLIEYMCIQSTRILLGCKQCYDENQKKYEFMKISLFQEKLNLFREKLQKKNLKSCLQQSQMAIQNEIQQFLKKLDDFRKAIESVSIQKTHDLKEIEKVILEYDQQQLTDPSSKQLKQFSIIAYQNEDFIESQLLQIMNLKDRIGSVSFEFDRITLNHQQFFFEDQINRLKYIYNLPDPYIKSIKQLDLQKKLKTVGNDSLFRTLKKIEEGVLYSGSLSIQEEFYGKGLLVVENTQSIYYGVFEYGYFVYGIKIKIPTLELYRGDFQLADLFEYHLQNYGLYEKYQQIQYEGEFVNEEFSGYGVYKNNGNQYFGNFLNGKFHGHGTVINSQKEEIEGVFQNGNLEGEGRMITKEFVYEGNFVNNQMHGYGSQTNLLDKSKYIGNFVKGKKEGEGILHLSQNCQIEGSFKNDQLHGYCRHITVNKKIENLVTEKEEIIESGEYVDGVKQGEFIYQVTYKQITKKYMIIYDNGQEIFKEVYQ